MDSIPHYYYYLPHTAAAVCGTFKLLVISDCMDLDLSNRFPCFTITIGKGQQNLMGEIELKREAYVSSYVRERS